MESWRNRKTLILSRTDMMGLLTPDEYNSCVEHAHSITSPEFGPSVWPT